MRPGSAAAPPVDPAGRAGVGTGRTGRPVDPRSASISSPDTEPVRHVPARRLLRPMAAALAAALVLACADGGDGTERDRAGPGGPDGWRGVELEEPVRMPAAVLTDTRGREHHLRREARGRITLLFFGYTHCPDVCPVQMANLGAVLEEMPPSDRRRIRVVFVTVDPRRDTAERLRRWLDRFGEGFVGLRGDSARVADLQRRLRLPPSVRQDRQVGGGYTVGHGTQVLAFGPDARARLAYPAGTRQRDWARDLPRLLRRCPADSAGAAAADGGGTDRGPGR